jgi:hypothetical protein
MKTNRLFEITLLVVALITSCQQSFKQEPQKLNTLTTISGAADSILHYPESGILDTIDSFENQFRTLVPFLKLKVGLADSIYLYINSDKLVKALEIHNADKAYRKEVEYLFLDKFTRVRTPKWDMQLDYSLAKDSLPLNELYFSDSAIIYYKALGRNFARIKTDIIKKQEVYYRKRISQYKLNYNPIRTVREKQLQQINNSK